jgi:serine/threonine protein kinase
MPVERNPILDSLRRSRLLSDAELAAAVARLDGGEAAEAVLEQLAGQGTLTPYQVRRVLAGKGEGLVLGQYRVLDELGRGGFGQVYKALHTVMGRAVAIKVIAPELVEDERARSWFKREVVAVTQLCHPNVVMAYDANEADGQLFLVMEYVEGQNLDALVRRQGPLPVALACELMRQAARGLQYAHEKGIVHRDIKPGNLLVLNDGLARLAANPEQATAPVVVKVVDFGLARLHQTTRTNTLQLQNEKSFLGTPDYVSPEQARDVHAVDIRSDLYSLGCTFYHALTGQRPFRGKTTLEIVIKNLNEDAEPLEEARPEVPPALCAAIRRLMEKDPARRFQSPAELIAELDFLGGPEPPRGAPSRASAARTPVRPLSRPTAPRGAAPLPFSMPAPVRGRAAVAPHPAPEANPSPKAGADPGRTAETPIPAGLPTMQRREVLAVAPAAASETDAAAATAERPPLSPAEVARLDLALRQAWPRWTAVVEAVARGKRTRLSEEVYRTLHTQLLGVCREQTEAAEGTQRAAFERLIALVEPWLTPQSLATADRDTLTDLLRRCKQVEQELGVGGGMSRWGWAALLAALAVAAFLGWRVAHLPQVTVSPASWWLPLKREVIASPLLWTLSALPVVVFGAVGLLGRRSRA